MTLQVGGIAGVERWPCGREGIGEIDKRDDGEDCGGSEMIISLGYRADEGKPFMGLTAFSGDFPTAKDIGIAKNYLTEEEFGNNKIG